jgi:hypothetical protein
MKLSDQILVPGSKAAISYTSDTIMTAAAEMARSHILAFPSDAERRKSDAAESWFAQYLDCLPWPRDLKSHANTCQGDVECEQYALIQVTLQAFSAPVAMCTGVGTQ